MAEKPGKKGFLSFTFEPRPVTLQAKPEAIKIDLGRTAVVVIDMQHAFCSEGGLFDKLGQLNKELVSKVIEADKKVIKAARDAGVQVIYVRWAVKPDLSDSGGPESPNWIKQHGHFITTDSWDAR